MDNENQRELDVLAALEGIHRMQESIRAANVYRERLGYGPLESEVEA